MTVVSPEQLKASLKDTLFSTSLALGEALDALQVLEDYLPAEFIQPDPGIVLQKALNSWVNETALQLGVDANSVPPSLKNALPLLEEASAATTLLFANNPCYTMAQGIYERYPISHLAAFLEGATAHHQTQFNVG